MPTYSGSRKQTDAERRAPEPARRPQPTGRAPSADLEYDVLSALDAALDPSAQEDPLRDLGQELALEARQQERDTRGPQPPSAEEFDLLDEGPSHGLALPQPRQLGGIGDLDLSSAGLPAPRASMREELHRGGDDDLLDSRGAGHGHGELDLGQGDESAGRRHMGHDELDLGFNAGGGAHLELDAVQAKAVRQPTAAAPHPSTERVSRVGQEPVKRTAVQRPQAATGPAPLSAAAVVSRPVPTKDKARSIALLQLLIALAVVSIGHWSNSSPVYGNAGLLSVIAHGLALQQLLLGARRLLPT